jgi:hypothetical protein
VDGKSWIVQSAVSGLGWPELSCRLHWKGNSPKELATPWHRLRVAPDEIKPCELEYQR